MSYTYDNSRECVLTTAPTIAQVVADLFNRGHVVTTWTDGDGSKFDLLWSWDATRIGRSSMVDSGPGKLFVAVVGKGCFGFGIGSGTLAPSYVREKLGCGDGITGVRLAEFIGGVRVGLSDHLWSEAPPAAEDGYGAGLFQGDHKPVRVDLPKAKPTLDNTFGFYKPED
jgi:hypothetical protein